jgi:3-mercaptopyruvate sulfurtransferase SseA
VALQLKKAGFKRVRPLVGGLAAWRGNGFPIEDIPREINVAVINPAESPLGSLASDSLDN